MIQDILPHKLYNEFRPKAGASQDSPVLCFHGKTILVRIEPERERGSVRFPTAGELIHQRKAAEDPAGQELIYGFSLDEFEFYLDLSQGEVTIPGYEYMDIHQVRSIADNVEGMILFTGLHLYQWYSDSRFCGACGNRMEHDRIERAMVCPVCGKKNYPRLFPAVIVGVINRDRLLVTKYSTGFSHYALIAGFCEIGETLEETVAREVMEEAGLKVKNIRYYKSQPWGIVEDLLAGFYCEVDGDDTIHMDSNELKLAQWKTRDEIELQPDSFSLTNEMMKRFKDGKI